ncbi:GGDEF domain-containing response regulator [Parablautia muri]|uniref:Stage 0 sporulation protein A homolog n=1 Tax=Parablautia muri TaxID=2320879 RepID=A0A9X5BDE4_9FIRM|nr:diguanylate cyclase [Parablautia muri]NBJ91954.1 diguanylate cyclase [Parablautia muri]
MKHILMVDDMAVNLERAAELLKDAYEISAVKSGRQALVILRERIPDMIIIDINMPDMNGYELMEVVRSDVRLKDIPVVFISVETDRESEIEALKMGAMDFIKKPFEPEVMRSRIERVLQMAEQKKELQSFAWQDGLTSLYNRRYIERLLNHTNRDEKKCSFMLLDLDNFKKVNDNFGHLMGDEVLVRFADVLKEKAGPRDIVCRLGGDEFAIYFPEGSEGCGRSQIQPIARKLIEDVAFEINDMLGNNCDFKVSVSIGIAEKPKDGECFSELFAAADKAMYFVKQNGKGGYHFHSDMETEKSISEEEMLPNLLQLSRQLHEMGDERGVYQVEYAGFKKIYNFLARCMERGKQNAQLVLFSIHDIDGSGLARFRETKGIETLELAIIRSLRRGDVATRCGDVQYAAILNDTFLEEGTMIAERIQEKFKELLKDDPMLLTYEIQSMGSIPE